MTKTSRNAPCPCGSGKKFKHCCSGTERAKSTDQHQTTPGKFQFQPGSYGGFGRYTPSIACLKRTADGGWKYHFVLVKPDESYAVEDKAVEEATGDLNAGFARRNQTGTDQALALYLREQGYKSVEDFQIVPPQNL